MRSHAIPIRRDGAESKILRGLLRVPRCSNRLEEPHQHAVSLLAEVPVAFKIFDNGEIAMYTRHRFGKKVVVLGRLQWHVDSSLAS